MMPRRSSRVTLPGFLTVAAVAVLTIVRPGFLTFLEYGVYDTLVRMVPAQPPTGRVVIVDIDERSLDAEGQWPWRRDRIGRLVARIREAGAAVVALDIIFAERDRSTTPDRDPDAMFADQLRHGRVILGYGLTFDPHRRIPDPESGVPSPDCVQHALNLPLVHSDASPSVPFFHASDAICNLRALTEAAGASGFLNAAPDSDGILRRVPLVAELGGHVYPALSLAAVRDVTGARDTSMHVAHANASALRVGEREIRVDGRANLLLRYRGPKRTFAYVSAADVLTGNIAPDTFDGKLVLVGTTALGTREVVSTPLDTLFTGVEVQATAADNLLRGDFLWRPVDAFALEGLAVIVLGVVVVLTTRRCGAWRGTLVATACVMVTWAACYWGVAIAGAVVSPLFPTLGLAATVAAMTGVALTAERHRADQAGAAHADSQRLMIQTLLSLTEIRDAETGQHSRRTQEYARVLAEQLAAHPAFSQYLTPARIDLLATLAPLHDIGKVGVPDRLLHKPGPLTPEELHEIRNHPTYGRDVILNAERDAGVRDDATLAMAKDIVYSHHERWDGTGYPQGLQGDAIPIPGRLMAVVDVYDALRSVRPYSSPKTHDEAVAAIVAGKGTHFDPAVIDAFVRASEHLRRLSSS